MNEVHFYLHVKHQITTTYEFNNKKQSRWRLEAWVKSNQKWMVWCRFKNMLFSLNPINILKEKIKYLDPTKDQICIFNTPRNNVIFFSYLIICHQFLFDDLHRVQSFRLLQFNHQYLGVASTANYTNQVEVIYGYSLPCFFI